MAIRINILNNTGHMPSLLLKGKSVWINAATIKEIMPAENDKRNHGRVIEGFLDLSQKKTTIAGRVAAIVKSRSIQIPFI
jgi:hypothetical protein